MFIAISMIQESFDGDKTLVTAVNVLRSVRFTHTFILVYKDLKKKSYE